MNCLGKVKAKVEDREAAKRKTRKKTKRTRKVRTITRDKRKATKNYDMKEKGTARNGLASDPCAPFRVVHCGRFREAWGTARKERREGEI